MKNDEIWVKIIIPIIIGPLFLCFKMYYDNYIEKKNKHKLFLYENSYNRLNELLTKFYWPLYIKLLCIYQLNYQIPIKNEFEYIVDSDSDSDCDYKKDNLNKCNICEKILPNNCKICVKCKWKNIKNINIENNIVQYNNDNIAINITSNNTNDIILDEYTINTMKEELNNLFSECLNIIENNMHNIGFSKALNKNLILFIKYIKIRSIINEGSTEKKYDIKYFGVTNNIDTLLSLVELKLFENQKKYNDLIENGPF